MNQFDGADTCVLIHKPNSFFQLITWALEQELKHTVKFLGVAKVDYDNHERQRSDVRSIYIHPALTKTKIFEPQLELRAIWELPEQLITQPYYDLKIVGLRKFCRVVDL